jgi:hypothetical protein
MHALKVNNSRIFHFVGNQNDCTKLREYHAKTDLMNSGKSRITEIVDLGDSYNGWVNFETWAAFTWLTSYEFTDNGADMQKIIREIVNDDLSASGFTQIENLGIIAVRLERVIFKNKNLWYGLYCDLLDARYDEILDFKARMSLLNYLRYNSKIVWADVFNALKGWA